MLSVNARKNDQEGGPPRRGDRGDRGDRPKKWVSASDLDSVLCFVSLESCFHRVWNKLMVLAEM